MTTRRDPSHEKRRDGKQNAPDERGTRQRSSRKRKCQVKTKGGTEDDSGNRHGGCWTVTAEETALSEASFFHLFPCYPVYSVYKPLQTKDDEKKKKTKVKRKRKGGEKKGKGMCKKVIKANKEKKKSEVEANTKTRKLAVIAENGCDGTFSIPREPGQTP